VVKKNIRKVGNLSRLMTYMLGTRPDEFGLVPDRAGYITIKELLKAINEEPDTRYVRESHIREVLLHDRDSIFEIDEKKIRSSQWSVCLKSKGKNPGPLPKILFKGVRKKAYPFILKAGLLPGSRDHVVLATNRDLAMRIARRLEQHPVLLEIRAGAAHEDGIRFYAFGGSLYLADEVPVQFISGPPLPKEVTLKPEPLEKRREIAPGSFILRAERDPDLKRRNKAKKRIGWKEEVRKGRKRKGAGPDTTRPRRVMSFCLLPWILL
jgi:putative RNA 2'-phosphotransferase